MTLQELLESRNMTKYRLSKESGVPWATLSDLCAGKVHMERCEAGTLQKVAHTLGVTVEDLLVLEDDPNQGKGPPRDRAYLEAGLPLDLRKSIRDFEEGLRTHSSCLDCLWGELYGSINANFWGGRISQEQADYLRDKYLLEEEEDIYASP